MATDTDNLTPTAAPETPPTVTSENAPTTPPAAEAAPTPTAAPEVVTTPPPAENILKRIVRAIDRAIAADPKRSGWALTCYMILSSSGGQRLISSSAEIERLTDLDRQHARTFEIIETHCFADAHRAYNEHLEKIRRSIQTGNITERSGKTLEQWESDFAQKQEAAQLELRRIYKDSWELCASIAERFDAVAEARLKVMQESEKSRHENWGVPYVTQSNLIVQLRKAVAIAKARVVFNEFGVAGPREMVPYINF